ncbi:MAG: hypothetical protein V5A22_06765 [Salinivenus sp.]
MRCCPVDVRQRTIGGPQRGLTVGLYNYARELRGVQIGLLNVARKNPDWARVLPLVNLHL